MTEYEIADLALSNAEAIRSQTALVQDQAALIYGKVTLFYTLLFSYVTVAYLVGSKLTKLQVSALNVLYICVIVVNRVANFIDMQVQRGYREELAQLRQVAELPGTLGLPGFELALAMNIVMVLASLIFMWSVRHPRT